MTPLQFGAAEQWLNGIYYEPRASVASDAAILLCAPIGQEHMRTQWSMRKLALQAAHAGVHVLRFDYLGTGDSAGDVGDARIDIWTDNIRTALAELAELSGVRQPTVLGLRFGALLAAAASAGGLIDARRLVFWDPVVTGGEFLAQLTRLHAAIARRIRIEPPVSSDELIGFRYPTHLRREIAALDLTMLAPRLTAATVDLLATERRPEYARLVQALKGAGKFGRQVEAEDSGEWDAQEKACAVMLAEQTIGAMCALACDDACGNALGKAP